MQYNLKIVFMVEEEKNVAFSKQSKAKVKQKAKLS
ncbi:hypothetical protein T11_421 [Trichinella zimbabwensis]|uniref:Uncharacterized protein n=1 Tax=Trichinella zimbabwensis TaxID=268475 RepID=A0A0V1GPB5_9BILA|nr:hypothetical protein T11_421 [Trichinella zimbabwensis]